MKHSLFHALWLLSVSAVATFTSSGASATVTPRSVAVADDGMLRGVLSDQGVWVQVDGRWHWVCDAALGSEPLGVSGILAVGAERLLVHGASGVIVSEGKNSCQWRAMAGSAGIRPVIAVHAVEPGGLALAFALGGADVRKIAVTDDGGATSATLDGLALAEHDVLGMAGRGTQLVVAARHQSTGEVGLWRSDDWGGRWTSREFLPGYDDFVPIALSDNGRIGGLRGADVGVYEGGSWTSLAAPQEPVTVMSSHGAKALVGYGEVVYELTLEPVVLTALPGTGWTAAAFRDDRYLLGVSADRPADPFVFEADKQGAVDVVTAISDEVSYAPLCESAMTSICRIQRPELDAALGLLPPAPDNAPAPPAPADGCSATENHSEEALLWAWLLLLAWSRVRYAS